MADFSDNFGLKKNRQKKVHLYRSTRELQGPACYGRGARCNIIFGRSLLESLAVLFTKNPALRHKQLNDQPDQLVPHGLSTKRMALVFQRC